MKDMNGTLLGVIALGLILVCLWIWMNILLTRPKRRPDTEQSTVQERKQTGDASAQTSGVESRLTPEDSERVLHPVEENPEGLSTVGALAGGPLARPTDSSDSSQEANAKAAPGEAQDLEVVSGRPAGSKTRIFDRAQAHPFVTNTFAAPLFEDTAWVESFYRLHEDPSVLGWIAFQNNSVGASDRDYDDDFVDVLRTYKRSVEKLRRQVGLTTVMETSIVGEEGKVWFLAPVEDAWLALFVDKQADLDQMTQRLLGPVRSSAE